MLKMKRPRDSCAVGASPSRGGNKKRKETGSDTGAVVVGEDTWDQEFHDTMEVMLADDSMWETLGSLLSRWDPEKVKRLVSTWKGEVLGVILGDWKAAALLRILSDRKAVDVLKCCESWRPKKIGRFLSRCKTAKARRVLNGLYFATSDPFLSHKEAGKVLSQWLSTKKLQQLCSKWDPQWVEAVLSGEDPSPFAAAVHSSEAGLQLGQGSEDSYDSSFIDDGSSDSSIEGSDAENGADS